MRSFTSSSKMLFLIFLQLAALFAVSELWVRFGQAGDDDTSKFVRHIAESKDSGVVIGDSQVGIVSFADDFLFFGIAGLQPSEMEVVARYLAAKGKVKQVMLLASPQIFGRHHRGRVVRFEDNAFPSTVLPIDIWLTAKPFRRLIKARVLNVFSGSIIGEANAVENPGPKAIKPAVAIWKKAAGQQSTNFDWSVVPLETRNLLSAARAYALNPVYRFENAAPARDYERAIEILIEKDIEVCLVETPVDPNMQILRDQINYSEYANFEKYIKKISEKYKVKFVNANFIDLKIESNYFWNQDHMNTNGAKLIWPKLKNICFVN